MTVGLYKYNMYNRMKNPHKHIQLVGTMTLGPKGQVVIPADVREDMGVKPGEKLVAMYIADKKAIGFVTEETIQDMIDHMGENVQSLRDALN